jgi:rapamycin-insensitive companion of mTOR
MFRLVHREVCFATLRVGPFLTFGHRSLVRDSKYAVEKEQVIKLIRAIVEIGSSRRGPGAAVGCGTVPLSEAVMRAFMAVAEHPDEPFKLICLQTLTEICSLSLSAYLNGVALNLLTIVLIDIGLVARTGGIRLLLHALSEGPLEMAPLIASTFLYIADSPKTRAYLHPGTDLEVSVPPDLNSCVH